MRQTPKGFRLHIGLFGRRNVGKSSLMNALLRRDRAIVTEVPGTTRDVLEEYINVRGVPFRIVDTAGIRETEDVVERIGVEKSREMARNAEFILLILNQNEALTDEDQRLLADTTKSLRVVVLNKADLESRIDVQALAVTVAPNPVIAVSAKQSEGLGALEDAMEAAVLGSGVNSGDIRYMTTARQAQLLQSAREDLQAAVDAAVAGATLDIVAVQLQGAYRGLGQVIGEEAGDDLLNEIFSRFCLGK